MSSHRLVMALAGLIAASACGSTAADRQAGSPDDSALEVGDMETDQPIRGRTIRWRWVDGLDEGNVDGPYTHEHTFHDDGTVTWRVISGPQAGHEGTEERYAAVEVGDGVHAISYLAESGYTLTVVLDFRQGTMVGFASGAREWFPGRGRFEVVE